MQLALWNWESFAVICTYRQHYAIMTPSLANLLLTGHTHTHSVYICYYCTTASSIEDL